jgi:salicylate hydroxylase
MGDSTILIVGGGIGGLAAALALARAGEEVRVLEAAPQFTELGAGIQIAPNATRVLDSLGIFDGLEDKAVFPRELVYMDAVTGDRITSVDLSKPFVERYGHPYIVLHRVDLHQALLDACLAHPNVELETDKHVNELEDAGDSVRAQCSDGSSYEGDALIGADGLHSVVRDVVVGDQLVDTPHVAYRGAIPFEDVTPHAGQDSMVMWVGPDLHFVQYKLRGGKLYNQVGVFRSLRYREAEDHGSAEELDEHFGRCCEPVRYGASLLERSVRWPMADREPTDNWTQNRITLVGDAAHAMLQYIAQGGCQALEDAEALGRHVEAHSDYREALLAYQHERIPRTTHVQRMARRFGETCHLSGVGRELRNHVFSRRTPQDYGPFDWLYGTVDTRAAAVVPGAGSA